MTSNRLIVRADFLVLAEHGVHRLEHFGMRASDAGLSTTTTSLRLVGGSAHEACRSRKSDPRVTMVQPR